MSLEERLDLCANNQRVSTHKKSLHYEIDRERVRRVEKRIRYITIILLFVVAIFLFYGYKRDWFSSAEPLKDFFQGLGPIGYVLSVGLILFNTLFPVIPGALPGLAAYMAYGPLLGYATVMACTLVGSVASFLISRRYGETFVKAFVPDEVFYKIQSKIKDEKTSSVILLLAYIIPGVPDDATTMIMGLSDMRLSRFIIICLIGKPLPTFLYLFGVSSIVSWVISTFLT